MVYAIRSCSRKLLILFTILVTLALLFATVGTASAAGNVCEIVGGAQYSTLVDAMKNVTSGGTIRMLANYTETGEFLSSHLMGKTVYVDPRDFTLNIDQSATQYSIGLAVMGAKFLQVGSGTGKINVYGSDYGISLHSPGSEVSITGDVAIHSVYGCALILTDDNISARINGNVKGCVSVHRPGSDVMINGNIISPDMGVSVALGGKVTVNGTITAPVYIEVSWAEKTADDKDATSIKPGYSQYSDGTSYAWVKIPDTTPPLPPEELLDIKVSGVKTLPKLYLVKGKSASIPAVVSPSDATNKKVTLKSSKPKVARVVGQKIKALKPGKAVITCTSVDGSNQSSTCTVFVVKKALKLKSLKANVPKKTAAKKPKVLTIGKVLQVKLGLTPTKATGIIPTYTSSAKKVATVDALGKISAVTKGKTTISIKAGGKTVKVYLRVK